MIKNFELFALHPDELTITPPQRETERQKLYDEETMMK